MARTWGRARAKVRRVVRRVRGMVGMNMVTVTRECRGEIEVWGCRGEKCGEGGGFGGGRNEDSSPFVLSG